MSKVEQLYGKPWSEREYVIALHFYYEHRESPRHENAAHIQELAKLLGRTPASIVMRMENFGSIDPDANRARKGLAHIAPMCRKVLLEWKDRRPHLRACAELLIREVSAAHSLNLFEPDPVKLPKAFDRYELLDRIGDGGFGSVFSCVDVESGREYAIKIIRADNRFDPETLHRFSREMRILSSVMHPNVIRLHERNLDTERTFPAFVMDLAQCSLTDFLQEGSHGRTGQRPCLGTDQAAAIFESVAAGIEALHAAKVIHRDVNPNNVLLLPSGAWVLADFGLAKFLQTAPAASSFVTKTHVGWGTAYYAAPEQYRDFKRTDERTDIYALGMLLWELLSAAWPPPDVHNPGTPGSLGQVFCKAVQREPQDRYQSVAELVEDFRSALRDVKSDPCSA